MTQLVPFNQAQMPAHIAAAFGEETNIAPRSSIDALTFKGKVWRTVIQGEEKRLERKDPDTGDRVPVQVVNLVVLDFNKARSRSFYEGGFTDGENKAPRCRSSDGVKPDADVKEPCASTCAECQNAVKGSLITPDGKATTACAPNKRIAVVPPSGAISSHPIMLLRLAQTSVWDKNNPHEADGWYAWDQYLDMLRSRGVKHTAAVETRVKFDPDKAYPKLLFSASRWLSEAEVDAAKARRTDDAETIAKILNGVNGNDGVAGQPGVPEDGIEPAEAPAAAKQPDKIAEALQAAKDAERAAKAAEKAAKAKAKADAEAQAEADRQAALAAAQVKQATEEEEDPFGASTEPAAPAAKPAANKVETETGTPAALADLLNGWDD